MLWQIERASALASDLLGDAPLDRLTTAMIPEWRDRLPTVPRLHPATVAGHVARLAQAIALARKRGGFTGIDPCDDVEPLDPNTVEHLLRERLHVGRVDWEPERLVRPAASYVYLGCRIHRRGDPGDEAYRDALYRAFYLCLFAGLRLGEALQLACRDVVRINGIWCVDVQAGPGQRLKKPSA